MKMFRAIRDFFFSFLLLPLGWVLYIPVNSQLIVKWFGTDLVAGTLNTTLRANDISRIFIFALVLIEIITALLVFRKVRYRPVGIAYVVVVTLVAIFLGFSFIDTLLWK